MFCVVLFHYAHNVVFFLGKRKINFKLAESIWGQTRWGRTCHGMKPAATNMTKHIGQYLH